MNILVEIQFSFIMVIKEKVSSFVGTISPQIVEMHLYVQGFTAVAFPDLLFCNGNLKCCFILRL